MRIFEEKNAYHLTKTTLFEKKSYFLQRCEGWKRNLDKTMIYFDK